MCYTHNKVASERNGEVMTVKGSAKRGTGKKPPKAAKEEDIILESEEELDKMYACFELDEADDIADIVSGRIGEVEAE